MYFDSSLALLWQHWPPLCDDIIDLQWSPPPCMATSLGDEAYVDNISFIMGVVSACNTKHDKGD